jgi:hypothetical protein
MNDTRLKRGELVRDKLNSGDGNYGLGVVVKTYPSDRKYEVFFTKFGTTITFHGDYLERI